MRAALCVAAAIVTAACNYDAGGAAIWTGSISRDGDAVEFVGYDPNPAQGQGFGSPPAALGYIEADGRTLLVFMSLEVVRVDRFVAMMASQLEIKDTFLTAEFGMGLTYIEQRASDVDATDVDQPYRQAFGEGHGGTTTGKFTVTATDFDTFLVGRLEAVLDNPTGGLREVRVDVRWDGQK